MKIQNLMKSKYFVLAAVILVVFMMAGCKGDTGPAGSDGAPGASAPTSGTVSGTVTSATGTVPLAGVSVTTNPNQGSATTAADGSYSLSVPGGIYTITFTKTNYTSVSQTVTVINGVQSPTNAAMAVSSSGKPSVTLTASGNNVGYTQDFTLTASATSPISATLSYSWTGLKTSSTGTTGTATSQDLVSALSGSVAPASDPGTYVSAYTQENRLGVLPIMADTRGAKKVTVKVTDNQGGSTSVSVTVNSAAPNPGVKQVAIANAVYLNSGIDNDTTTTWTVTGPALSPTYSTPVTLGTTGRNPSFTPDVEGKYVVSAATPTVYTMDIYAGKYVGAISGGSYTTLNTAGTKYANNGMWYDTATFGSSPTFTNWPTVAKKSACNTCHGSSNLAIDTWAPWSETVHATFFSRGIEGINTNGGTCLTCHTVGYDGVAGNGNDGFDDRAATAKFVYAKKMGAWSAMTTSTTLLPVAEVANIQCENCHGPQSTLGGSDSGHMTSGTGTTGDGTNVNAVRVSYSAEVCGTCHASGTGHHIWSEWKASGHSNLELAMEEGLASTSATAAVNGTSCARCHAAQGYGIYLDQMKAGTPGNILNSKIDWDETTVQPQTCTACHDPHSDANPNQLRVNDKTDLLPSGFSVVGMGKGAICVTCHNSRGAMQCVTAVTPTGYCSQTSFTATYLHEDGEDYNGGAPASYSTAHASDQGDVFMGRNAYFMGTSLPMISKHANAEDTCAGCHISLNPQTHTSSHGVAVSGHVMAIEPEDAATVCANCHSANVTPEALQANVDALQATLGTKMSEYVRTAINSYSTGSVWYKVTPNSACSTTSGVTFDSASSTITSANPGTIITFTTGTLPGAGYALAVGDIITTNSTTNPGPFTISAVTGTVITVAETVIDEAAQPSTTTRTIQKFMAIKQGMVAGKVTYSNGNFSVDDGVKVGSASDGSSSKHSLSPGAMYTATSPLIAANAGTTPLFPLSDTLVKAVWNSRLLQRDATRGIHNPSFTLGVLNNTIGQF